jgi:uncharacterized coiled-coil DUF342 family protein
MKSITQMVQEHKDKLQAIRDRKGTTAELIDQTKANSAEIIAELEALRKERVNPETDLMTGRWLTNITTLMAKASKSKEVTNGTPCQFLV